MLNVTQRAEARKLDDDAEVHTDGVASWLDYADDAPRAIPSAPPPSVEAPENDGGGWAYLLPVLPLTPEPAGDVEIHIADGDPRDAACGIVTPPRPSAEELAGYSRWLARRILRRAARQARAIRRAPRRARAQRRRTRVARPPARATESPPAPYPSAHPSAREHAAQRGDAR